MCLIAMLSRQLRLIQHRVRQESKTSQPSCIRFPIPTLNCSLVCKASFLSQRVMVGVITIPVPAYVRVGNCVCQSWLEPGALLSAACDNPALVPPKPMYLLTDVGYRAGSSWSKVARYYFLGNGFYHLAPTAAFAETTVRSRLPSLESGLYPGFSPGPGTVFA